MIKMIKKNYKYNIVYDYNVEHNCDSYGCDDEGICRCMTITDIIIKEVDINGITLDIFRQLFDNSKQLNRLYKINNLLYNAGDDLEKYFINRILVLNKAYDVNKWRGVSVHGYYGDEIEGIDMDDELYNSIISDLHKIFQLETLEEKIDYLLMKEYGEILPSIKDKRYTVEIVDVDDINIPHLNNVEILKKSKTFLDYNFFNEIKCICIYDGKWRLIDGYHRMAANKDKRIKIIGIK